MIHPRIVFDLSLSFIQTKVRRVGIDTFDYPFIQKDLDILPDLKKPRMPIIKEDGYFCEVFY